MATIHIDIIDGNSGEYTKDGWKFTRHATVRNVTGLSPEKVRNAVEALVTVTGDIYSPHPAVPQCLLLGFFPTSVSGNIVKIRIVYEEQPLEDDPGFSEVGSAITQVRTNKDKDGNKIELEYTYPATYPDLTKRNRTDTQGGMVTRIVPESTIAVTRREGSSPGAKSKLYVGKVNKAGWDQDPGADARTWLCTSLIGRTTDRGRTYDVSYSFQFRGDTWDETAIFINPDTGKPPPDLEEDVGSKLVVLAEEIDFNDLNL